MKARETTLFTRRATIDDAEAISLVLHEAFVEYEPIYTSAGFAATTPTSAQIQQRMSEGPLWVAFHENTLVGTVSAVLKDEAVYVRGMAILPGTRGLGLGTLLLAQVEAFAAEHHAQRLFLSTTPFLARAIRLYERAGFQCTNEGPDNLFGTPLFTMEKLLPSH